MPPRNTLFFAITSLLLIVLIFFAPSYGWALHGLLGSKGESNQDIAALNAQNEVLTAQLDELQSVASEIPNAPSGTIRAMVYSRYPMNFKNQVLINAGANDGVIQGKPVLFQGVLIGTVQKVFSDTATVTTVFDPMFRMPVRIGSTGIDGLFQGGAYPQILSIAKNSTVSPGDVAFAAGSGIPYDIPVGTVANVAASPNDLFDQATLNFAYDINSIQTVLIEK